jgi:hypothetical protein
VLSDLTTNQKGAIAEIAIASQAIRLGIEVYRPIVEGGRFDCIFLIGSRLVRVQCKWAPQAGDIINVRCRSCTRTRTGLRHRGYTADEIDAYAAYCPNLDRCYFLPYDRFAGAASIQLRLEPSRNNQRQGIHWASDYEFGATLARLEGP